MSSWWNRPVSASSIFTHDQPTKKKQSSKNTLYFNGLKLMEIKQIKRKQDNDIISKQCLWGTSTTPGVGSYTLNFSQIHPQPTSSKFNAHDRPLSFLEQSQNAFKSNPGVGHYNVDVNRPFKKCKQQMNQVFYKRSESMLTDFADQCDTLSASLPIIVQQ
ncbi:hypothetical protein SS50377_20083 [Spironucleus salmonicida]|uniref:Uncharacterized protein n=1 Tax=Spironucleus salmonicida TaxID=348837 RepID=V6LYL5_9EUKA|nr:hypothetical protein SS50377_20083 [Spironucleus salmonicida]|eukprot:EST49348.1 Hypothetical protein SS50377_10273 [Spironucleus salmonicida]